MPAQIGLPLHSYPSGQMDWSGSSMVLLGSDKKMYDAFTPTHLMTRVGQKIMAGALTITR